MWFLWALAVIVGLVGVKECSEGHWLGGILLIVLAFAIGPGGWTIWSGR